MTMQGVDDLAQRALEVHTSQYPEALKEAIMFISDRWPYRDDMGTLMQYLVHDCRNLAEDLGRIAHAAEGWLADMDEKIISPESLQ